MRRVWGLSAATRTLVGRLALFATTGSLSLARAARLFAAGPRSLAVAALTHAPVVVDMPPTSTSRRTMLSSDGSAVDADRWRSDTSRTSDGRRGSRGSAHAPLVPLSLTLKARSRALTNRIRVSLLLPRARVWAVRSSTPTFSLNPPPRRPLSKQLTANCRCVCAMSTRLTVLYTTFWSDMRAVQRATRCSATSAALRCSCTRQ